MRTLLTAILGAMGLLLAACGTPERPDGELPGEATAVPRATDVPDDGSDEGAAGRDTHRDLGDRCENPKDGYRIRYPEAWHANDGEVTAPCRAFDVEVPEIQPETELPLASSTLITVTDRGFDEMRTLIEDDPATEVHDVVESELDGRAVLRVDGIATGEALLNEGVEVHRTYVALGERTLVASANDLGEPELDARRDLIAEMLATLEPIEGQDDTAKGGDGQATADIEDQVRIVIDAIDAG